MTLSRRMKISFLALMASVVVLVGGMLWGLYGLRRDVNTVFEEYQEARLIEEARVRVNYARILLRAEPVKPAEVLKEFGEAVEKIREFLDFQKTQQTPGTPHEAQELQSVQAAYDVLSRVIEAAKVEGRLADVRLASAQLGEAAKESLQALDAAAKFIDATMVRTRRVADITMHSTLVVATVLAGGIGAVVAAMSYWQYRKVIIPLRLMRDGAQRLAGGHFDERIGVDGDEEFSRVAVEFNRMADELDTFYHDLEEKVRTKSKALVQSERLASVGFLAAGVAHEINNPLNIISGYAELTLNKLSKNGSSDTSRMQHALGIIREEAFRCKQITEQLLSLARSSPGNRELVAIPALAEEVRTLVFGLKQFHDRPVELHFDGVSDLAVLANKSELKQVLLNLTINALEAVKPVEGVVRIGGRRDNGWVEILVADNGRGMTPQTIENVFEPFYTERKAPGGRGVGLGLAITHAIVEAHGGAIRAESEGADRGSRFIIRLPAPAVTIA